MTRIFTSGFEMQSLGIDVPGGSISSVNSGSHGYVSGRFGGYAYRVATGGLSNHERFINFTLPAADRPVEWFYRGAHRIDSGRSGTFFYLFDNTGAQIVRLTGTHGSWSMVFANSVTLASGGFSSSLWYLFRIHYRPGTPGEFQFYINANLVGSWEGNTSLGPLTSLRAGSLGGSGGSSFHEWDDIAINDPNGTVNNGLPDDGFVRLLVPNGNGDRSEMVGSDSNSVDNYLLVDDVPHNSDTDYVNSAVAGEADLYNLSTITLAEGQRFVIVQPIAVARTIGAIPAQGSAGIKTGTTEDWGDPQDVTTSYTAIRGKTYEVNPETGLEWAQSDIDNLQAGYQREL